MPNRFVGAVDLAQAATPASPAANRNKLYPKPDGKWYTVNSAGSETLVGPASGTVYNAAVTAQTGFSADTYLVGSSCAFTAGRLQVRSQYRLKLSVTKTAAGTAAPVINIRLGTAGTTSDTTRVTLTFAAQTAAVDTGFIEAFLTFRSVGASTSAVLHGIGTLGHTLASTGLSTANMSIADNTSSGFDSTTPTVIGASVNGGASAAWTVNMVQAELYNLT